MYRLSPLAPNSRLIASIFIVRVHEPCASKEKARLLSLNDALEIRKNFR
ncbi:hypothetical protein [Bartonella vinsonii]|nr:hypothetical protein [Bartonella vinsonii]